MIAATNRDIRRQLWLAELRRAQAINSPLAYLDRLIALLESLHLDGHRFVPPSFGPAVRTVNRVLPQGIGPIPEEPGLIRDTIDRCFLLQEQLLGMRQ